MMAYCHENHELKNRNGEKTMKTQKQMLIGALVSLMFGSLSEGVAEPMQFRPLFNGKDLRNGSMSIRPTIRGPCETAC